MIPISKPFLGDLEKKYLNEALSSGWISSKGYFLNKFEEEFSNYIGTKHCITTANGTVAIHLALLALGLGKNDEVILPDLTFVASANGIVHSGAKPIISEINLNDWSLDVDKIKDKITSRTKAIMPVHIYGFPVNMEKINEIANEYNLLIIEDVAEAHGATFNAKKLGAFGNVSTFSFFANKIITSGEGGCILTNNDEIANEAKFLRDHAMDQKRKFWHPKVGYNYRMTNLQASIACAQLEQINFFIEERENILNIYRNELKDLNLIFNPVKSGSITVNWLTSIVLQDEKISRDNLMSYLNNKGIEVRPFFEPLSNLPMYQNTSVNNDNANFLSNRGLNLPTFVGLKKNEIVYICNTIKEFFNGNQKV